MVKKERIGEENVNLQGLKMKIIDYRHRHDIDVQFEDGYISKSKTYGNFKKGKIKNLYYPEIYGIGYIGEGKYKSYESGKYLKSYVHWHQMFARCYDNNYQKNQPTYVGCSVCSKWHNFQNFAEWYEENYYEVIDDRMELDKDILIKGNKIYSPETCIFVPHRINSLFIKNNKSRGKYPIGVHLDKNTNKYKVTCRRNLKEELIGYFLNEEDAFMAYKEAKQKYIKQVAEEYKGIIPEKLYNAMYKWEVEITD